MKQQEISQQVIELARSDTPNGFEAFYILLNNRVPPVHAMEWVRGVYKALEHDKYYLNEAFRGSTKSTTFRTFLTYQIGLYPHLSNLLAQAAESKARKQMSQIATAIEHNLAFRAVFPNVVPDPKRAWGAEGYFVKRTDIDYNEWVRMLGDEPDPTFVGYGRTSNALIGSHPTGLLVLDDFEDETLTRSERESELTRTLLTGTVFPAANSAKITVVIGTPWDEKDTLAYCKATGEFECSRTPVTLEGTWPGTPTWLEFFGIEKIKKEKNLCGEIDFARMYLLNLELAKGKILKKEWLLYFPFEEIKEDWSEFMGMDYASTADKQRMSIKRDYHKERDEAAIAWGRLTPQRTLIVVDGWSGKVSKQETLMKLTGYCTTKPYLRGVCAETIGKGNDLEEDIPTLLLMSQTYVPLLPLTSHGKKSKGDRFEGELAVLFQQGRILLSSKITPFLKKFIDQWLSYSGTKDEDDLIDAVYMLWKGIMMYIDIGLPDLQNQNKSILYQPKKQSQHPLANASRW